jgi:hypothetical protein
MSTLPAATSGERETIATIRWLVLELSTAANNCSPPAPGYHEVGTLLFYVSDRGRCWLVRDARGLVQLTPAVLPRDSRAVDEITCVKLGLVAEAADLLEQRQPAGIYHDADIFYVLTDRGDVFMFYGTYRTIVRVPCLPPYAVAVDIPPREIAAAIERMGATG